MPLFNREQAEKVFPLFKTVEFEKKIEIGPGITAEYFYVGHILGAAALRIQAGSKSIVFTGDVGRLKDPIFHAPVPLPTCDYLVTESTYGNRLHEKSDVATELQIFIEKTIRRGGTVLIPTFAVGRAQSIIYWMWQLKKQKRIPNVPVFLNSPMATNVNDLLDRHSKMHKLSREECTQMCASVRYVRSPEDSKALNENTKPKIIISASGMLSGGRILHHMKAFASDSKNSVLLTGFQAAGTRGEALQRGTSELKIHGQYVPIKCEVQTLHNMSAHADYAEIEHWLEQSNISPKKTFIVHGEPSAADELRRRLSEKFNWHCLIPEQSQEVEL